MFFQHKKGRVSWRPMRIPAAPWGAETKTDGVSFCDTPSVGLVGDCCYLTSDLFVGEDYDAVPVVF